MQLEKLAEYLKNKDTIEGWFQTGAAQLFALVNQIQKNAGISGNIFEIGVHHGKSTVLLGMMITPKEEMLGVCDVFDLQEQNITMSGKGNKNIFINNFLLYCNNLEFLKVHEKTSDKLTLNETTTQCRLFHIDGGHAAAEAYSDLQLASEAIQQQGIIVVDDYFNQAWPGVSEGVCRFLIENPNSLAPLAIGFNKLLLCKPSEQKWYLESLMQDEWKKYITDPKINTKLMHFFGLDTLVYYVLSGSQQNPPLYQRSLDKIKKLLLSR